MIVNPFPMSRPRTTYKIKLHIGDHTYVLQKHECCFNQLQLHQLQCA